MLDLSLSFPGRVAHDPNALANFKLPRRCVIVAEIPEFPAGTLLRRKLVAGEYDPASSRQGTAI